MPRNWPERAPGTSKRRSNRLMKKMKLGQFQELGCELVAKVKPGVTDAEAYEAIERLIVDFMEPRGLQFGGGWEGAFVARNDPGSVTESDRAELQTWLQQEGVLESFEVGPLRDAWYF